MNMNWAKPWQMRARRYRNSSALDRKALQGRMRTRRLNICCISKALAIYSIHPFRLLLYGMNFLNRGSVKCSKQNLGVPEDSKGVN